MQNSTMLCKGQGSALEINGNVPLYGSVEISAAKNSFLILLAASLLTNENVILFNKPEIRDVAVMMELVKSSGKKVSICDSIASISGAVTSFNMPDYLAGKIRASIVMLGGLVSLTGNAILPLPGGDKIGNRPVDIHIDVLKAFNVECRVEDKVIYAEVTTLPINGANVFLRFPSVLATCNAILLAVLAKGETNIYSAACEPEITDMAIFLNKMGARICGAGTTHIRIVGVTKLGSTQYDAIPDRIEAATYLIYIALCGGEDYLKNFIPEHNHVLLSILQKSGMKFRYDSTNSILQVKHNPEIKHSMNATTMPYPGLATDIQPILVTLATQCSGKSTIQENIFPERFNHIEQLAKMGADIWRENNTIYINGKKPLNGITVEGNDIRSTAALIGAALAAEGTSRINGVEHLARGYSNFINKIRLLNADVKIIE